VQNYEDVEIVTFKGFEKESGQELLETMLAHQDFEEQIKKSQYKELGVGCACNSKAGIECMMIFGNKIVTKEGTPDAEWMWIMP